MKIDRIKKGGGLSFLCRSLEGRGREGVGFASELGWVGVGGCEKWGTSVKSATAVVYLVGNRDLALSPQRYRCCCPKKTYFHEKKRTKVYI